jgi:hypothetical protein
MDTGVYQNIKAKQIQHFYRVYKFNTYLKKFKNLDLEALASTISFIEFTRVMRKKNIILGTNDFLDNLSKLINEKIGVNNKIMLSGYLINYYADELLDKPDNRHPVDKGILEWSQELIKLLEETEYTSILNVKRLGLFLNNFNIIFNQWKTMDKSRTIERIIVSYNNRSDHIDVIKQDKNLEVNQKSEMLEELEKQREQLLYDILLIDPEFNTEYFKENYKKVYNDLKQSWEKIFKSTGNVMKKAYYDMVSQEIQNGNSKPLYDLLIEISKRILIITPEKRKDSLIKKLNGDNISEILSYGDWNEDLIKHIKFLGDIIVMFSAPIDDKKNLEWKKSLDFLEKYNYTEKLPLVLIEMEEKLDKIFRFIIENSKKNNKK